MAIATPLWLYYIIHKYQQKITAINMCHLQYLIIYDMVKVNVYQVWDLDPQNLKAWYTSAIGTYGGSPLLWIWKWKYM